MLKKLTPLLFKANQNIEAMQVLGRNLRLHLGPHDTDPSVTVALGGPLCLESPTLVLFRFCVRGFVYWFLLFLLLGLLFSGFGNATSWLGAESSGKSGSCCRFLQRRLELLSGRFLRPKFCFA